MTDNTCTGEIYLTSKIWPYTRKYAVHVHISGGGGSIDKRDRDMLSVKSLVPWVLVIE